MTKKIRDKDPEEDQKLMERAQILIKDAEKEERKEEVSMRRKHFAMS